MRTFRVEEPATSGQRRPAPRPSRFPGFPFYAVLLLSLLAFAFRFYRLADWPPGLHYDEAFDGLDAHGLLSTPLSAWPIFFTGNFGREPLFIYLLALSQVLLGPTVVALRTVTALVGALLTPALAWLGWEMAPALGIAQRRRFALWAGLAPLALLWSQVFARYAVRIELLALIEALCFASLWRAWRVQRWRWWMLAGALAGLSFYTYLPSRLLPLVLIPSALLAFWRYRSQTARRWPGLLVGGVMAVLVAAPLVLYFLHNPVSFTTRTGQVSLLGQGGAAVWNNVEATLGMAFVRGDANPRHNLPGRPVFDGLATLPFLLGLLSLLRRPLRPAALFLLSWLAVMLLPTALSEYAPAFHRAIGAMPAFALLLALGVEKTAAWAATRRPTWTRGFTAAGWAVLLASTLLAWRAFAAWSASPDLFFARDVGFVQLAQTLAADATTNPIYLSPRGVDHPTLRYLLLADETPPDLRGFDGRLCLRIAPGPARYLFLNAEDFRGPGLIQSYLPDSATRALPTAPGGQPWASEVRQPATGRVQFPERISHPASLVDDASNDHIMFLGYWLSETHFTPTSRLYVRLFWQAQGRLSRNYTTFVHLLAPQPDGSLPRVAGVDAPPGGGSCPTDAWQPGEIMVDELQLVLPADLPEPSYHLAIGFYDPATGRRLPIPGQPADQIVIGPFAREGEDQ